MYRYPLSQTQLNILGEYGQIRSFPASCLTFFCKKFIECEIIVEKCPSDISCECLLILRNDWMDHWRYVLCTKQCPKILASAQVLEHCFFHFAWQCRY
jgi:hypothetical protein